MYDNEESAALYLVHNYVAGIGSNTFENANGFCDVKVLSSSVCTSYEIVRKMKTAKRNGNRFHSFYFDLGIKYMEGLFNAVSAVMALLLLQ